MKKKVKKKVKKITKAQLLKKQKKQERAEYNKNLLKWKNEVKTRDTYICQMCFKNVKEKPSDCHAHHILDKKNFKEFSLDILNGITLCYRCHKVGKRSPHMNAVYFGEWLRRFKPELYNHALTNMLDSEKIQ